MPISSFGGQLDGQMSNQEIRSSDSQHDNSIGSPNDTTSGSQHSQHADDPSETFSCPLGDQEHIQTISSEAAEAADAESSTIGDDTQVDK